MTTESFIDVPLNIGGLQGVANGTFTVESVSGSTFMKVDVEIDQIWQNAEAQAPLAPGVILAIIALFKDPAFQKEAESFGNAILEDSGASTRVYSIKVD